MRREVTAPMLLAVCKVDIFVRGGEFQQEINIQVYAGNINLYNINIIITHVATFILQAPEHRKLPCWCDSNVTWIVKPNYQVTMI